MRRGTVEDAGEDELVAGRTWEKEGMGGWWIMLELGGAMGVGIGRACAESRWRLSAGRDGGVLDVLRVGGCDGGWEGGRIGRARAESFWRLSAKTSLGRRTTGDG